MTYSPEFRPQPAVPVPPAKPAAPSEQPPQPPPASTTKALLERKKKMRDKE
jgi:hypothetical protein